MTPTPTQKATTMLTASLSARSPLCPLAHSPPSGPGRCWGASEQIPAWRRHARRRPAARRAAGKAGVPGRPSTVHGPAAWSQGADSEVRAVPHQEDGLTRRCEAPAADCSHLLFFAFQLRAECEVQAMRRQNSLENPLNLGLRPPPTHRASCAAVSGDGGVTAAGPGITAQPVHSGPRAQLRTFHHTSSTVPPGQA